MIHLLGAGAGLGSANTQASMFQYDQSTLTRMLQAQVMYKGLGA